MVKRSNRVIHKPRFISSRDNPLIKQALKIKARKSKNYLIVEGEHPIEMARASLFKIIRVFFSRKYKNTTFLRRLSMDTEVIETREGIISTLSDTENPQGIIAIATYETFPLNSLSLKSGLLVICDEIQDPGNLGTIIRTADAVGADAVIILPRTCDPFIQKVIRASAGSIFNIPVVFSDEGEIKVWLKQRGIRLIVTAQRSNKTIYDLNMKDPVAFVFGNEARGVSEELLCFADEIVNIPILGKAESLNVSVAAAVCLYEAVRQRIAVKNDSVLL